jgi:iron complex transport system permease protein
VAWFAAGGAGGGRGGADGEGGGSTATLLLSGVAVGMFLTAAQTFLMQRNSKDLQQVYSWLLGSLATATWSQVAEALPYTAVSVLLLLTQARRLDVLALGDDEARSLGLNPGRTRLVVIAAASLAAATAVAVSGLIGFVGIVVPHVARRLGGHSYAVVLPLSLLIGGGFLSLADTAARTALSPAELPIGVVTAAVGAPVFIMILRRTGAGRR